MEPFLTLFHQIASAYQGPAPLVVRQEDACYAHALTPAKAEITRGDNLQGGVAVMVRHGQAQIQAFVLRLVCTNGLIAPHTTWADTCDLKVWDETQVAEKLMHAMQTATEALPVAAGWFREAHRIPVTPEMLNQLEHRLRMMMTQATTPARSRRGQLWQARHTDFSALRGAETLFDAVNAITAVAREVPDPQLRWSLELKAGHLLRDHLRIPAGSYTLLAAQDMVVM
ncbi:MAG: DUF932 domain-containing protein [Bacteroidia bacterium]|nr:DUF932 domain-containing protein [Bacteroidia bacterium]